MTNPSQPSIDAVELLVKQHRQLEAMLKAVTDAEDAHARQRCLAPAADELVVHIGSEETVFYPAVRAVRTKDILLESLEEHLSLKRLLADLLAMEPDDERFEAKCKVLREQAEHHHREEEDHLFPQVRQLLGATQRRELGARMDSHQRELRGQERPRDAVQTQTDAAQPLN